MKRDLILHIQDSEYFDVFSNIQTAKHIVTAEQGVAYYFGFMAGFTTEEPLMTQLVSARWENYHDAYITGFQQKLLVLQVGSFSEPNGWRFSFRFFDVNEVVGNVVSGSLVSEAELEIFHIGERLCKIMVSEMGELPHTIGLLEYEALSFLFGATPENFLEWLNLDDTKTVKSILLARGSVPLYG